MNQVIFARESFTHADIGDFIPFDVAFTPVSTIIGSGEDGITDKPNEDFIIEYMTPSKTIKTIEVNRETLNIQKINQFDVNGGEYKYSMDIDDQPSEEGDAVQIIRQDAVPHQRNSWYIELSGPNRYNSFKSQLKVLAKSNLLGILEIDEDNDVIKTKYPLTFKVYGDPQHILIRLMNNVKSPYQYLQMLITKHVQNFGYNHTDDNAELNSGLADYKAWIAGTESDTTVAVYRLRFATNRKASKTRDERVWQNVYICTKGQGNSVASLLDDYIAILNGENTNEGGGE